MLDENLPKAVHNHTTFTFPEGFLWGAATSAHQVEGNNFFNDWWEYEQTLNPSFRSGEAADQYKRFHEDFELAKSLSQNSHRLSVEWSRIEPEEGKFDPEAIEHYKKVLASLKSLDFTVMLTLWHFTLPAWVAKKGGWENEKTVFYFERFVKKVAMELGGYIDYWITINEPGVYSYMSYLSGKWPPLIKDKWRAFLVLKRLAKAHKRAYKIIHQQIPDAQVGLAHNVFSFENSQSHSLLQHLLVWIYDLIINHFIFFLTGKGTHDFLGLNYYLHERIGSHKGSRFPSVLDPSMTKKDVSDMGWELYPEGMFDILKDFSDFGKPIIITENGLASTNDDRRCRFLIAYLKEIYHAIVSGVDVKGYFHWSLIDNFEWGEGFGPRFGLIEIDYKTKRRTPRPSASVYANVIRHNGLPHYLLRFLGHTVNASEVLAYDWQIHS